MEERLESDIGKYTQVIQSPGSSIAEIAQALISRGVLYNNLAKWQLAITDFTQVIEELPDVPLELINRALFNRALAYEKNHDHLKAVADKIQRKGHPNAALELEIAKYTQVIQHPDSSTEEIAQALINRSMVHLGPHHRGIDLEHLSNWRMAEADLTRVIEDLPSAPEELVVQALFNRITLFSEHHERENVIADLTQIIENHSSTSTEMLVNALLTRASWNENLYAAFDKNNSACYELVIGDYTKVIEDISGVSVEQIAATLIERGRFYAWDNKYALAFVDYTRVVDQLPGVSMGYIAQALNQRGDAYLSLKKRDLAFADFKRVLALPGNSDNWHANSSLDSIYCEFGYPFEW